MKYKPAKTLGKIKKYKHNSYIKVQLKNKEHYFFAKVDRNTDNWIRVSNIFPLTEETPDFENFEIVEEVDIQKAKEENPLMFI